MAEPSGQSFRVDTLWASGNPVEGLKVDDLDMRISDFVCQHIDQYKFMVGDIILSPQDQRPLRELFELYENQKDHSLQIQVVNSQLQGVISTLQNLAQDTTQTPLLRLAAAKALLSIGASETAIEVLREIASTATNNCHIRIKAGRLLHEKGEEGFINLLQELVNTAGADPDTLAAAARELGELVSN